MDAVPVSPSDVSLAVAQRLSSLLLDLYAHADRPSPDGFCDWALDRVKPLLPFDSASWGHGSADPIVITEAILHNQSPEKADAYRHVQHDDYLFPEVCRRLGEPIDMYDLLPRRQHVLRPIYKSYARRFGGEQVLCTASAQPGSGLIQYLNLWRADLGRPFTRTERWIKRQLMPHLVAVRRLNTLGWAGRAFGAAPNHRSVAVVDRAGMLHEGDPVFVASLRLQWPGWRGPRLPDEVAGRLRRHDRGELRCAALRIEWEPLGSRVALIARPVRPVDRLTRRQREVAGLLVDGHDHKSIARVLGVEPNTVRTHIAGLYRAMGVSNRAQLVARMIGGEDTAAG